MNSSGRNCENDNRKLQSLGKSVSCDNLKANSCIELADIRKLDSLLNQCESISCDNLLLLDEIYNYDLCGANRRKYASMSAINKILPKNSIRRRAHKKILGIRESDTKIINFLDGVRNRTVSDSGTDANATASPLDAVIPIEDEQMTPNSSSPVLDERINCCDKNIQTSQINLNVITLSPSVDTNTKSNKTHKATTTAVKCLCANDNSSPAFKITPEKHVHDHHCSHHHRHHHCHEKTSSRKKEKRKQCSCRDYKNVNTASAICETSLSTTPVISSLKAVTNHQRKLKGREKSDEKSTSGKCSRLMKQKNTIIDDDDSGGGGGDEVIVRCEGGSQNSSNDGYNDNRVIININKSIEIIPISLNSPYCSRPTTPHLGTSTSLQPHHDAKSDKSETQSQKSKRSKFSPSFISRKLTSRLNSSELEDGAGGAKESLLGRAKSTEKKLPDPVETVCIVDKLQKFYLLDLKDH